MILSHRVVSHPLRLLVLLPLLSMSLSCAATPPDPPPAPPEEVAEEPVDEREPEEEKEPERVAPPAEPLDRTPLPVPDIRLRSPDGWAEETLSRLTLRQKVGQMMMPFILGDYAPEGSASHRRILRMIDEEEIGGAIVSVGTPVEVATKLNVLQRRSNVPLLVAADLETGAGFRLRGAVHTPGGLDLGGATDFPPLMAVGATDQRFYSYEMGRVTAREARAVGIHVPFAPVLDVNNNSENPIINTRAFGEDPTRVAELGACFIRGLQDYGALATGKHFPGHGDTEVDSHLALPVIRLGRSRLDEVELVPFRMAIESGMGAVMTAHIAMPGITGGADTPATLSRPVITDLLRGDLGFQGLVFTDAMDMSAIDRLYSREEAAVRAVEAGVDVILMPPSPMRAIQGIMEAVLSGRISEERIDESALRILRTKERMGLHENRTVDVEEIHRVVGIPEHIDVARTIAERSLTLLKNDGNLLPLRGTRTAEVMSVTYRRPNALLAGRFFDAELGRTYPRLDRRGVTRSTRSEEYDRIMADTRDSDLVVVSIYVTATAYAGDVAVPEELSDFLKELSESGTPHVVVSFGNPYLLAEFPDVRAYLLGWGDAEVSQRAAAAALLGEVPISGSAPTRIPPFEIGAGIALGQNVALGGGAGC